MAMNIKICKPMSPEHQRANAWFSSLIHQISPQTYRNKTTKAGLEQCVDFFRAYAQTGDKRFLGLCEDFLKATIAATGKQDSQRA